MFPVEAEVIWNAERKMLKAKSRCWFVIRTLGKNCIRSLIANFWVARISKLGLSPEMRRKLVVRLFDGLMTMVSLPPSNVPPSETRVSFLRGGRWGVSHPLQVLTLMMLGRKQVNGLEFSGASKTSPELSIFDRNISCKMYQISKEDQKSTFWQNGEMKRREEKRKRETAQERR